MSEDAADDSIPPSPAAEPDHADLVEIARQLQGQVDHLVALDERRRARIEKLERDRAELRRRLDEAESRRLLDHVRHRRRRPRRPAQSEPDVQITDPGLTVPDGVGHIPALSLPPRDPARPQLRVATILDEFSAASFGPEFTAVPLSAMSWREQLEEQEPVHLLFVESAFRGHDGSWAHRVARWGDPSRELTALVEWCRNKGIPTVFWNKEDPVNFGWFLASAALFDQIFTVDGDVVSRYRRAYGHSRVGVLPFAAQPAFHYPPDGGHRPGAVAFAGSYYASKHPERRAQMDWLLEPARSHGLHIFDRMAGSEDPRFRWPERFQPHIIGRLTYPQMLEVYRRYRVFINVNTVTSSPTMCARRIFELAASGAATVSGPSRALAQMVPEGAIRVVEDADGAASAYRELLADVDLRQSQCTQARRWVLDAHTYSHRVRTILDAVGVDDPHAIAGRPAADDGQGRSS